MSNQRHDSHDFNHDGPHHQHHSHDHGPRREGPPGGGFLDLEISKVVASEANRLKERAAMDIIAEALRERLRERLGERLGAIGRIIADEFADDIEANLEIEARIAERIHKASDLEERLGQALREAPVQKIATPRRVSKRQR